MRVHREYSALGLWAYGAPERLIAQPANVAVVRFELVWREGATIGWLDVLLETPACRTVLSPIQIDLSLLVRNDPAALVYPQAAESLFDNDDAAAEMTDFLLPAVRALTRARTLPLEDVWYVRPSAAFDRARAALHPGAAPLAASLPRIARWAAAIRLAGGGPVAIRSRDAALGAAVAAHLGSPVTAGSSADPDGHDGWFPSPATSAQSPAVFIADRIEDQLPAPIQVVFEDPGPLAGRIRSIDVIEPLPMDLGISYDPQDGPVVARSWVVTAPAPVAPACARAPLGSRSDLALAFIVRPDFHTAPDSDTDEVDELVLRVRAAGGEATILPASFTATRDGRELPVIWGAVADPHVRGSVAQCVQLHRPFALVLTPESPDSRWYEAALQSIAQAARDEDDLQRRTRAFDAGTLEVGNPPPAQSPEEWDRSTLGAALAGRCFVGLAVTDGPEDARAMFGLPALEAEAFGPLIPPDDGAADAASLVGLGAFAFVHAAANVTSGLAAVVLALRDTEIPLVIAAAPSDASVLVTLRRIAGRRTVILTDLTPSDIHALYRAATLVIDPALRSRGVSRVVRAARSGAIPVVFADAAAARLLPPACLVPRPAVSDLRDTVRRLWDERRGRVLPARLRSTVGRVFGAEERVAHAAARMLAAFGRLAS